MQSEEMPLLQEDIIVRADRHLSGFAPGLWRGDCEELLAEATDALREYRRLGKIIYEAPPCLSSHGECERCTERMKARCEAIRTIAEGRIGRNPECKSI